MNVTNDEDTITCLLRENEELKSVLKAERKRSNSSGEMRDHINTVQECLQRIEEKVEEIQDNFNKKLDNAGKVNLEKFTELEKKMTNVEDSISKFPQPYLQYVQHWLNSLPENRNIED